MGFQRHAYRRRSCIFGESDTHAHTFSEPNRDSYADCNTDTDAMHGEMFTHAEAAPDSCAASVVGRSSKTVAEDPVVTQDTNLKAWPSLRVRCSTNSHEMSSRLAQAYEIHDNSCNSCLEQAGFPWVRNSLKKARIFLPFQSSTT